MRKPIPHSGDDQNFFGADWTPQEWEEYFRSEEEYEEAMAEVFIQDLEDKYFNQNLDGWF